VPGNHDVGEWPLVGGAVRRTIASDKVEGTSVFGADETQIGSIERVMIDKRSGKVSYAVLSFGRFLGVGVPIKLTVSRSSVAIRSSFETW
jgi:hypothetical protein